MTTFHNEESKETKFIEVVRNCFLFQHNQQNSRERGNDTPSLIDPIFTDEDMQGSEVEHQSPLGKSDHNVITYFIVTSITQSLRAVTRMKKEIMSQ